MQTRGSDRRADARTGPEVPKVAQEGARKPRGRYLQRDRYMLEEKHKSQET